MSSAAIAFRFSDKCFVLADSRVDDVPPTLASVATGILAQLNELPAKQRVALPIIPLIAAFLFPLSFGMIAISSFFFWIPLLFLLTAAVTSLIHRKRWESLAFHVHRITTEFQTVNKDWLIVKTTSCETYFDRNGRQCVELTLKRDHGDLESPRLPSIAALPTSFHMYHRISAKDEFGVLVSEKSLVSGLATPSPHLMHTFETIQ